MTRDQLRLVLQPDDQLVKIKTVIAIDDHSDGEHASARQDLKTDRCISGLIHCDRKSRTVQKRAKVTAVLAVVTIKHELPKFPENLLGSQSVAP
jgi:hypothetical protein